MNQPKKMPRVAATVKRCFMWHAQHGGWVDIPALYLF
jgi:hypothetical protein